jgi:hypothetical protein
LKQTDVSEARTAAIIMAMIEDHPEEVWQYTSVKRVYFTYTTRRVIPQARHLDARRCENMKSHILVTGHLTL